MTGDVLSCQALHVHDLRTQGTTASEALFILSPSQHARMTLLLANYRGQLAQSWPMLFGQQSSKTRGTLHTQKSRMHDAVSVRKHQIQRLSISRSETAKTTRL